MPDPAPPPATSGLRRALTWIGVAGLVLVLVSAAMLGAALARGVHCPGCDRLKLGDGYAWWEGYFRVMLAGNLVGGALGLVAAPLAHRRLPALAALLVAAGLLLLTPR